MSDYVYGDGLAVALVRGLLEFDEIVYFELVLRVRLLTRATVKEEAAVAMQTLDETVGDHQLFDDAEFALVSTRGLLLLLLLLHIAAVG